MSHSYRYFVFAAGKQPTVEEVNALQAWSAKSKVRYAVGINGDDGCLTLAFEAAGFDTAISAKTPLAKLLQHWQDRGGNIHQRLPFIKKPTALQPMPSGVLYEEAIERRSEPSLKRKQRAAQEALALAGLKLQRTLEQHAWLQRIATVVPYVLVGLAATLILAAGVHFSQRLQNSPTERRQQTIQRVASDAMEESLQSQNEVNHQDTKGTK